MRPLYRKPVNKRRSSSQFRKNSRHTKGANMRTGLARGGIRL